jgi:hypothetical protein
MSLRIVIVALAACAATACAASGTTQPDSVADKTAGMTAEEKIALYNEAADTEGDQLVCRREHKVGTNFKRTVCFTRTELEEMRRAAQDELQQRGGIQGTVN